jgi:hypothetical protein
MPIGSKIMATVLVDNEKEFAGEIEIDNAGFHFDDGKMGLLYSDVVD